MIDRYDPFSRMMSLRQMMDRLLEDAFVVPRGAQPGGGDSGVTAGALNIYEEDDTLIVEAPLPGMRSEDINVVVEQGVLTIRGEKKVEEERKERNYLVREHRTGSFVRSLRLPGTVDPDACQATFENGVLRLVFPKSEQAKSQRIEIAAAGQQPPADSQASGNPSTKS